MSNVFFSQALHILLKSTIYQIQYYLFIECQTHQTPENHAEQNWISQKVASSTKGYFIKQQKYFQPPTKYSEHGSYIQSRHSPTSFLYNQYRSESYDSCGYIPSGKPSISTKSVPKFTKYPAQENHLQSNPVSSGNFCPEERKGSKKVMIPSHILKKGNNSNIWRNCPLNIPRKYNYYKEKIESPAQYLLNYLTS